MVKAFAPNIEKFSLRLWFIAFIAVIMPIKAIIPRAIMVTVMPVRSLLLFTVRYDKERVSEIFMGDGLLYKDKKAKHEIREQKGDVKNKAS